MGRLASTGIDTRSRLERLLPRISRFPVGTDNSADVLRTAVGHVLWEVDYTNPALPPYSSPGQAYNFNTEVTLAHEIGHNLGLRHTNTPDSNGAEDPHTCYPYAKSSI